MKYLGIDWGLKRVGLAISEGELAAPLPAVHIKNLEDGAKKIADAVTKEEVDLVVIGKPEGEMGKKVEKAVSELKKQGIRVAVADETLSTQEAKKTMLEMGSGRQARREDNSVAAAIILQRYLDER